MRDFPLIKFVILLIMGILFQELLNVYSDFYSVLTILLLTITFIFHYYLKKKYLEIVINLLLGILVFLFGSYYYNLNNSSNINYPFNEPKIRNAEISGEITKIDLIKNNKISLELNLDSLNRQEMNTRGSIKFNINFWKDTTNNLNDIYNKLSVGNNIKFVGTVSRAKNQRNPGEFDYEKYLKSKGVYGVINCYKIETIKIINEKKYFTANLIFNIRKIIDERIKELHNHQASGLLKGILLADRSDIDYKIKDSFINSGVIHVLAVSGLHVGFISAIFFLILGRFDIRVKYLFTIIGILIFLIITGGHASVFRASTMAIVFLTSKLVSRSTNGFNSISIAALIILLLNPNDLFNPGFLLSFSAVISILIIYPIFSASINKIPINKLFQKLLLFITVSLSAQLGTLPFTLIYFNKLSIISLFANIIVIPVIGFIVSIGILTLITSIMSFWLASVFASANIFLIDLLFYFVKNISDLSFSFIPIYNFSVIDGIIFYMFLALVLITFHYLRKRLLIFSLAIILLISMNNYLALDDSPLLPDNLLSIVFIDVDQGDSFLIKFPSGTTALIDAGNSTKYFDNGERVIFPLLQRLNIDTINYAFISHLDSDHFGGSISLINKGIIENLYKPKDAESVKDSIFEEFLTANNVNINYYSNQVKEIDECKLYMLNDTTNYSFDHFDSNNKSGILKIQYGNASFLFVGDAEFIAENYLIERYGNFLKSDVLKVGHHGSKTSSSDIFLDFVNPQIGVISAGVMNRFNHPSESVINKLKNRNIEIRRTDYEGAIILTTNGKTIESIDWRNY